MNGMGTSGCPSTHSSDAPGGSVLLVHVSKMRRLLLLLLLIDRRCGRT